MRRLNPRVKIYTNRRMSGPGYRKRYIKDIALAVVGYYPSANNALTLRHVGKGQGARVPWVAGRICFGVGAGQPHPFTGSGAPPGGTVSAGPVRGRRECGDVIRKVENCRAVLARFRKLLFGGLYDYQSGDSKSTIFWTI